MADDIEEIREQKLEQLQERAREEAAGSPEEPIPVAGADELGSTTDEHDVVLVDFYADWCGPCQMLEPVVETIAAETEAAVAKVDVDANQQLAAEYGVRGVPTMVLFADGEPVERLVGMQDESQLRQLIDSHTGA
ncbi:thioredoxin [Halolamina rubra]|uniref:thioredoxin n=1 Tax=Halolamina rubra TaxID=1380430 RepID=UPI000679747A|nr:thioredoxin [Halolamina rubra]